jgi:tRNA (mo5U34)-methyltransferase
MWPWRKGPLNIFDIEIDAEWRADFKWKRLLPHIKSLRGKHILDIGSNNGYYMFRMSEENPAMVMGVEPYINYYMQFLIMKNLLK